MTDNKDLKVISICSKCSKKFYFFEKVNCMDFECSSKALQMQSKSNSNTTNAEIKDGKTVESGDKI